MLWIAAVVELVVKRDSAESEKRPTRMLQRCHAAIPRCKSVSMGTERDS